MGEANIVDRWLLSIWNLFDLWAWQHVLTSLVLWQKNPTLFLFY